VPPGPSAYPTSFSPSRVLSHNYEIDLTDDHADALREAFSDYVAAALKVTDRAGRTSAGAAPKRGNSEELAKVREWANTNGHEVSSRGRISQAVRDAYDDAAPQTKRPATPRGGSPSSLTPVRRFYVSSSALRRSSMKVGAKTEPGSSAVYMQNLV